MVAAMLMAVNVHWPRFFAQNGGFEYALLILAGGLAVALSGPGAYSLDALLGITLPEPTTVAVTLGLAVIGAAVALGTRAPAPSEAGTVAAASH